MTTENGMASLAGWLEVKCGPAQAQYIMDEIHKTQQLEKSPECMELMLMADLIDGYRKELLHHIKEFKALRRQESTRSLVTLHIRHKLKEMEEIIKGGIFSWATLRDDYFLQRACYMEQCRRTKSGSMLDKPLVLESKQRRSA